MARAPNPLDYASHRKGNSPPSVWGFVALALSLLLSPLLIVPALAAKDASGSTVTVVMIVAVIVPLISFIRLLALRRRGWGWALTCLIISVIGWGIALLVALAVSRIFAS